MVDLKDKKIVEKITPDFKEIEYWTKRRNQLFNGLEKDEIKLNKKLKKYYTKEIAEIDKEIAMFYGAYGKDGIVQYKTLLNNLTDAERKQLFAKWDAFAAEYPQYAHLKPIRENIYKLNRLEGLKETMSLEIYKIAIAEQTLSVNHLTKWIDKAAIQYNVNANISKTLLNEVWAQGGNFSDRIWNNKTALIETVNKEITHGFIRGDNYKSMCKTIKDKMGVSYSNAMRLVYTEGTYTMNESQARAFAGMGFETYTIDALNDSKTCSLCSMMSGETFEFEYRAPGDNFPPFHPNCRCKFTVNTLRDPEGTLVV